MHLCIIGSPEHNSKVTAKAQGKDREKSYLILGEICFSREPTIAVLSGLEGIRP